MQNNSNKNWENKGWEAMHQMLDKELPAEEKEPKRRILFWYWAAGVAVLIGVVFLNLYQFESNLISDENSRQIAEITRVESNDVFEDTKKLEEDNSSQSTNSQHLPKQEITSIFEQRKSIQKNHNQSKPSEKSVLIKDESTVKTKFELSTVDNTAASEMTALSVGFSNDLSEKTDENKVFIKDEKLIDFADLPMLFADLNLQKIELFEAPKPNSRKVKRVERQKKKAKPVFGISASITSDITLNANGFQAGAFVDLPMKNPKFALQTGINYRLTRQREIRQNWTWGTQQNGDAGFFDDNLNGGVIIDTSGTTSAPEGTSSDYYFNNQKNQIESFQYSNYHTLSIPLSLKYKLHSKWEVLLGAEGAILLNFLNNNPSAQLTDRALDISAPAFENFATFKLRNFDFAGIVAVNFQPLKHWQLNLKYHHGNLFQGNNWQVDNRFLSVGGSFIF